jgi:hypothetical protein
VFEGFEFGRSVGRKAHDLLVSVPFERQPSMDQERSTILRSPAPILDVLAAIDDRPSPGLLNRQDASLCHDHILSRLAYTDAFSLPGTESTKSGSQPSEPRVEPLVVRGHHASASAPR